MALEFNGTNQWCQFPKINVSKVSFGGWFRLDRYNNWPSLFGSGDDDGVKDRYNFASNTSDLHVRICNGIGGSLIVNVAKETIGNGLNHLYATYENGAKLIFYLNGTNVGESEVGDFDIPTCYYNTSMSLGGVVAYGYFMQRCYFAEIYDRVLTPTEVLIKAKAIVNDNNVSGLKARWLFLDKQDNVASDNSANEVKDVSGNGNHGTCFNGPTFFGAEIKLHSRRR